MRILQLCHKPPYPIKDGGCLAINQISQGLINSGVELNIVSIVTPKHPFIEEDFPEGYIEKTRFTPIFVDTRINAVDAFINLVTQDSYHVSRFFSSDLDNHIRKIFEETDYDVVLLESIFTAPYIETIRKISKAAIVLRSHNLEFSIWHRIAKSKKLGIKKAYLNILTRQLKDYEIEVLNLIDGLVAINPDELKHYKRLGLNKPSITIPFGVNLGDYTPGSDAEPNTIFHIGSMDWEPNLEGIAWLLEKVWPIVIEKNPYLKLKLAGRRMPQWLLEHEQKGVEIVGEVEEAQDFIRENDIMIIPLFSGGGMRVKLIEALALEKPVVSTPLGANGVDVKHRENIILASKPKEFADGILKLADDKALRSELARNGRKLVKELYDTNQLSEELVEFLKKLKR